MIIFKPSDTIKICVSGSADMSFLPPEDYEKAKTLGREIVKQGSILITGATTGFPLWAAMGAREAKGFTVGFSPAGTEKEHVTIYRLPLEALDVVVYTGFGYAGRNLILTRSTDAVIVGPGRVGTINEFTVAYEDAKPIGILEGDWETDEVIKNIMNKSHRVNEKIIFDDDPKRLVERIIKMVKAEKGVMK